MKNGERLQVLCVMTRKGKETLQRIGSAFVNIDGSINVYLDAYPANGKLVIKPLEAEKVSRP